MQSDIFYMLEVHMTKELSAAKTFKERVAIGKELVRRKKAVRAYLKAKGHSYHKRATAFATREEAEQAVIAMGFPYEIDICEATWAF